MKQNVTDTELTRRRLSVRKFPFLRTLRRMQKNFRHRLYFCKLKKFESIIAIRELTLQIRKMAGVHPRFHRDASGPSDERPGRRHFERNSDASPHWENAVRAYEEDR